MFGKFELQNADNLEALLTIRMKVKEWKMLKDQLKDEWPSSDLSRLICDLINKAEESFYVDDK